MRVKSIIKTIITWLFRALIVLGALSGLFWLYVIIVSYAPESDTLEQVKSQVGVVVEQNFRYLIVRPEASKGDFIYYPGGLVYPESYLPNAVDFTNVNQVTVYILEPPLNAAIFGIWMADWVSNREQLEEFWVGGHSLGGIAACRYVKSNPERVESLILHASYCDQDIADFSGEVISIMGDNDMVIDRDNYVKAKQNLPATARIIEVEGLNHSAFGSYGLQKGDGDLEISDNPWLIQK